MPDLRMPGATSLGVCFSIARVKDVSGMHQGVGVQVNLRFFVGAVCVGRNHRAPEGGIGAMRNPSVPQWITA